MGKQEKSSPLIRKSINERGLNWGLTCVIFLGSHYIYAPAMDIKGKIVVF